MSYEICLKTSALKKFSRFSSCSQLPITRVLLQNSLKELLALLNLICPETFVNYAKLDSFLHKADTTVEVKEQEQEGH